jgi:hypothetical protein
MSEAFRAILGMLGIIFALAIFVAPPILLAMAWVQVACRKHPGGNALVSWIALIIATSSDTFFWLSAAFHNLLGPHYSNVRSERIFANVASALVISVVVACSRKAVARSQLLVASLSLACMWFFVAAISSVV